MVRLTRIAAVLFVIAVPLFLVTASVTFTINNPDVYHRGFAKYQISPYTGITEADLHKIAAEIRHYFNSGDEPLAVKTRVFGVERELFNQREVEHMRDVKSLIRKVYAVAATSGGYLLVATLAGFVWLRRSFIDSLARLCLWGGTLTLALVFVIGLFSLVGFDTLFLKFHQLSFSNDLWQLDPRNDYLLIMFPEGFWFDTTMLVAALAVAGATLITALSSGYLLFQHMRQRKLSNLRDEASESRAIN